MPEKIFWRGKKVLVTGHTGFKGSWLCLWLSLLGAKVTGYALKPPTNPSLFEICEINKIMRSITGDISDLPKLRGAFAVAKPQIVIHMAAQSLVRDSYKDPLSTYHTNVIGTVNLFEAVRVCGSVRVVVNITSDKCYENDDSGRSFKEGWPLGGFDPYSNSKACSELVTSSYRASFFSPDAFWQHKVAVASARSGNVIGGGDWATDRLVPDFVRSALKGKAMYLRNPKAVRPWQHVLDPLNGYLILAEKLYKHGPRYCGAWNFGCDRRSAKSAEWIIKMLCKKWGGRVSYLTDKRRHPHEAAYLKLDCSKAKKELRWVPKWDIERCLDKTIEWTKAYQKNNKLKRVCDCQIREFMETNE